MSDTEILWLDGDIMESYDELLEHLWVCGELEGPDNKGIYTFHGGRFPKEALVDYLKGVVEHNKASWDERDTVQARLTQAEQERDSLRTELDEANAELDLNTELMRKQNAACAEMRGALELGKDVVSVFAQFVPDHIRDAKKHIEFINTANHALSSSAGRDLLERVRKLEEDNEVAKMLLRRALWRDIQTDACRADKSRCSPACEHYITCQEIDAYLKSESVQRIGLKCIHGILYPSEGDPKTGPWECNPDGSNPACLNCSPDAWKKEDSKGYE